MLLAVLYSGMVSAAMDPWVLIDTKARTLTVYHADQPVREFKGIAIGRGGASKERYKGDGTTPLGTFRIMWVNSNSRYDIFLGLDYPTMAHATTALSKNHIKNNEFKLIRSAFDHNTIPPQDTSLGGYIGIHGLGNGSIEIHRKFNWTNGCVAMTNDQIEELARLVSIGTEVVIR
jgi:L,D-peptidoglycan transpeptidase YkuD (ErfK/YbiS/YcfS/YnhG family)